MVGAAAAAGLLAGWLIPRGPVITAQAVTALIVATLVGAATGWWTRSRWAMVPAPVAFMRVCELARVRVDGPTVDGIRLDGIYGVITLVAGRGVDAVLIVLPMIVGASYGADLARRSGRLRPDRAGGVWCDALSWGWRPLR